MLPSVSSRQGISCRLWDLSHPWCSLASRVSKWVHVSRTWILIELQMTVLPVSGCPTCRKMGQIWARRYEWRIDMQAFSMHMNYVSILKENVRYSRLEQAVHSRISWYSSYLIDSTRMAAQHCKECTLRKWIPSETSLFLLHICDTWFLNQWYTCKDAF